MRHFDRSQDRNLGARARRHAEKVTEGVVTYVAIDENGRPRNLTTTDVAKSESFNRYFINLN